MISQGIYRVTGFKPEKNDSGYTVTLSDNNSYDPFWLDGIWFKKLPKFSDYLKLV